jgi:hypothetical protein
MRLTSFQVILVFFVLTILAMQIHAFMRDMLPEKFVTMPTSNPSTSSPPPGPPPTGLQNTTLQRPLVNTEWSCEKIQHWNTTNYKDGYVIARKNKSGLAECVKLDNSTLEHTGKCSVYTDKNACQMTLATADVLTPSTCTASESIDENNTCTQLKKNIWQCRAIPKDDGFIYYALRKNNKNDIECLGNSFDSCVPFQNILTCVNNIKNIQNEKHLQCGEMMYNLFGKDGYTDPTHYCSVYKDIP